MKIRTGFDCGYGWYGLIYSFIDKAEKYEIETGREITLTDIKEKYGALCISLDWTDEYLCDLENKYEDESGKICEKCGSVTGVEQVELENRYIKTLCKACEQTVRTEKVFIKQEAAYIKFQQG
jgi:hypothetical protein